MSSQRTELRSGIKYLIRFTAILIIAAGGLLLFGRTYQTESITVSGLTYYTEEDSLVAIRIHLK